MSLGRSAHTCSAGNADPSGGGPLGETESAGPTEHGASYLTARSLVPDLTSLAEGIQRLFDSQEDLGFERADRSATAQRQRDRGHGHVVGSLPQRDPVVCAEAVPEAVEGATDRLDVRPS